MPYEHHGHRYEIKENDQVELYDHEGALVATQEHEGAHFIIEEPMHEHSHETFHGREQGYMYREHGDEHVHGHLDYHTEEPRHGIRHGETFAAHHMADQYEVQHGHLHDSEDHYERYHAEHFI